MNILLILAPIVSVLTAAPDISPSVGEHPFDVDDKPTVEETLNRYPYLRANLHPDIINKMVSEMPDGLKVKLQMVTLQVKSGRGNYRCYAPCLQANILSMFLQNRFYSHSIGDVEFVMYVRDQLHDRTINEYIESTGVQDQQEKDQLLARYRKMVVELPAFLYSVDLDKVMERNKFIIPDRFMALSEAWNPFRMWELHRDKARSASARFPWQQKEPKAFWRGVDSGHTFDYVDIFSNISKYFPRFELLWQSHLHPDLIDARFNAMYEPYKRNLIELGMPEKTEMSFVDISDHIRYKYLVSVDGWTASWLRVPWIMASNSLLIKQESRKIEWFTYLLKPYVHYYPIGNDISGLVEAVQYLEAHQDEALKIIKEANAFIEKNFTPEVMTDAICDLFRDYAKAQNQEKERVQEAKRRQKDEEDTKATSEDTSSLAKEEEASGLQKIKPEGGT